MNRNFIIGDKFLHFDDGKIRESTSRVAEIIEIIEFKDANKKLIKKWENEKKECPWLYATETDVFLICHIFDGGIIELIYARTIDGDFFSLDNTCYCGRLDINYRLEKELRKIKKEDNNTRIVEFLNLKGFKIDSEIRDNSFYKKINDITFRFFKTDNVFRIANEEKIMQYGNIHLNISNATHEDILMQYNFFEKRLNKLI